jgi:predicted PurR-regulated permease PerM
MTVDVDRRERWTMLAIQAWAVIGVLTLLYTAALVVGLLTPALVPFGLALVIVVVLRGPVARLERLKVPRGIAVALCYLVGILIVSVGLLFVVPALAQQVGAFASALPDYVDKAYKIWTDVTQPKGTPIVPSWVTTMVLNLKDAATTSLGTLSKQGLSIAFAAGSQAVTLVFSIVLGLIISFYTLLDLDKMSEEAMKLVPESRREDVQHGFATVSRILGGWMRGAFLDSLIVGTLIAVGLTLLGVPYGVAIGMIAGVLNVVPYLGPVAAAGFAAMSGLFTGNPWLALWAVVIVLSVQQFDNLWLNPRIMSSNVDLHPVLVVFSLLTGATLFGVPGMLLAVPVAAICKGLFVYYFERRTSQSLCTTDGVLFKSAGEGRDEGSAGEEPFADPAAGTGDKD